MISDGISLYFVGAGLGLELVDILALEPRGLFVSIYYMHVCTKARAFVVERKLALFFFISFFFLIANQRLRSCNHRQSGKRRRRNNEGGIGSRVLSCEPAARGTV